MFVYSWLVSPSCCDTHLSQGFYLNTVNKKARNTCSWSFAAPSTKTLKQECIPVGYVPPSSVAVSPARTPPALPCHTCPLATYANPLPCTAPCHTCPLSCMIPCYKHPLCHTCPPFVHAWPHSPCMPLCHTCPFPFAMHKPPYGQTKIILGDGRWTVDGYVTITVYLHKSPVTPSPWNKVCCVMITMDRPSPSMITHL